MKQSKIGHPNKFLLVKKVENDNGDYYVFQLLSMNNVNKYKKQLKEAYFGITDLTLPSSEIRKKLQQMFPGNVHRNKINIPDDIKEQLGTTNWNNH